MPTITHDPDHHRREIAYTREEVEDLIWRDCEARGYRVRPEAFVYRSGMPTAVEVLVPETDGPADHYALRQALGDPATDIDTLLDLAGTVIGPGLTDSVEFLRLKHEETDREYRDA